MSLLRRHGADTHTPDVRETSAGDGPIQAFPRVVRSQKTLPACCLPSIYEDVTLITLFLPSAIDGGSPSFDVRVPGAGYQRTVRHTRTFVLAQSSTTRNLYAPIGCDFPPSSRQTGFSTIPAAVLPASHPAPPSLLPLG